MPDSPASFSHRLVVIGGGAAGFFCAVNAARMAPGLEVILLEKTSKLLSKVSVSGGGRCNLTHACFDRDELIKNYPRGMHFVRKAFHQFFTKDTVEWFEARAVALKTEQDGRMFPATNRSETIVQCLRAEAAHYNVRVVTNAAVTAIQPVPAADEMPLQKHSRFRLIIAGAGTHALANEIECDYVCVACGGFAKPTMFDWIAALGHTIEPPLPSLFTFNLPKHPITALMGVSVTDVLVKIAGTKWSMQGPLLITHWGCSGPAILKLSAWAARDLAALNYHFMAVVNWLPSFNEQSLRTAFDGFRKNLAAQKLYNKNPFGLPARLWEFFLGIQNIKEETRWADLKASSQNALIKMLCATELPVAGKTTFKEEFVTAGGIRLSEIDPSTMMSRKVQGLYFAGEIMDVDGITGGFNFQHAWTSGFIAAKSVAASL
jgi:predicted Rossmann fold flavoprotein